MVLVLALLLGLQPVTTDLYLPGLPALSAEFGGVMSLAQLTLSGLILAFGIGQLAMGPLSDRFGRRPVLIAGLGVYGLGSVTAAVAPSIELLVSGRLLQGVGLAASVVCGRAMVRDLYDPLQGAAMMSRGQSGLGAFALLAPVLGGGLVSVLGWRAALLATGVIASLALLLVLTRLPEPLAQRNPHALVPARMAADWARIVADPAFRAWALLLLFSYAGLFTFLASSSFVYIKVLGASSLAYGLLLGSASLSYLVGTFVCRRWIARLGIARTVARAAALTLAGGLSMAVLSLAEVFSVWAICLPQALFNFAHGMHQPCGQAGVVAPFPVNAGAASALSGFASAAGAFAIGLWLGHSLEAGTVYPLTLALGLFASLTALVAWTLVQRLPPPGKA